MLIFILIFCYIVIFFFDYYIIIICNVMYNFILVVVILFVLYVICYIIAPEIIICYNIICYIYFDIIIVRSFIINIFVFSFLAGCQTKKTHTTTPLNERRKCLVHFFLPEIFKKKKKATNLFRVQKIENEKI